MVAGHFWALGRERGMSWVGKATNLRARVSAGGIPWAVEAQQESTGGGSERREQRLDSGLQ